MASTPQRTPILVIAALVLSLCGLALASGGAWLILLGGSWYYAIAGIAFLVTGGLLFAAKRAALWLYAGIVLGSLAWALWESGLDWWALAARGGFIFVLGLLLLLPWVTRPLRETTVFGKAGTSLASRPGLPFAVSLFAALAVAVVSWFTDPHDIDGRTPVALAGMSSDIGKVPAGEWHAYGRTQHGTRYSPLAQITPENASSLQKVWEYHTGDVRGKPGDPTETTFEVTPLKIGGNLYFCTPHQYVIALNADTGEEVWKFDPEIRDDMKLQHLTCRGLGYQEPRGSEAVAAKGNGCDTKLFMPTADGRLIALNPETGERCRSFGGGSGEINLWQNMPVVTPGSYYSTSPPVVTRDLVIVGGTVLDNVSTNEASGVIRAFDVETGELVWNWDPADPKQTEPIPEGETYTHNSPNSWSISSVDEKLGLVYIPLGNQPPDQWGGNRSEAVERYSSSVVALDLRTGKVRWHFQTVHHDLWDYDVPSQPSLVDLAVGGETVPALVQPTKQGEIYVLDRRTGEPILPVEEVAVPQGAANGDHTAPTQPVSALSYKPQPLSGKQMWGVTLFDQLACRISLHRMRYQGRYTPPSEQGSIVYPGNFGVFNWGSIAIDPERHVSISTPAYLAFVSQLVPRQNDTSLAVHKEPPKGNLPALNENFGAPYAVKLKPFYSLLKLPCQEPPWGYISAADLTTGEILWMHKNGTVRDLAPVALPFEMGVPDLGGPITTAGGVAFLSGTLDYYVRAYDVTTGEELWKSRLPAGGQATPMTYAGEGGRQYVLVVAGGHGSLGTKAGDSVIAYALP